MHRLLRESYAKMPLRLKKAIGWLPYRWCAGHRYRETVHVCHALDSMSREEVIRLQERQLRGLLEFAVQEVPFYRSFRSVVDRLRPFDALKEFPALSKEGVQQRVESLIPDCIHEIPYHEITTGGSSGRQLRFLEDDSTYAREMGFMHSQWARVGYTTKCTKATFRGIKVCGITDSCFWHENPIHNEIQFSPFHMNEETLGLYCRKLTEYQPDFIHGYPSAVDCLAEYVLRRDISEQISRIRAVLLGSEACSKAQRDRIEAAFHTRVYTWYGHSERTVLGGECECSQAYHAFPAYGILELVKENGEPCDVGEQGEIVGTGFLNRSMPLIRYRTDDYATRESHECECGRSWDRFSHVAGRRSLEGFVLGKHGSRVSDAALNVHDDCFNNVIRYQYYQKIPGQLVVRVIPNPVYSSADEAKIIASHAKRLWGEMDIVVQRVNDIPLTALGKQKRLVCEVECQSDNGTANAATQVG